MRYIYGPVASRRLGASLGVCLTPYKVCPFDCVYCQLGRTTLKTIARKEYLPSGDIIDELRRALSILSCEGTAVDYITFSGFGEPTLNKGIAALICRIKEFSVIPVALITNSALLADRRARGEIMGVDLIVPSLDAADERAFRRIDRPCPGVSFGDVVSGLVELRQEFRGQIYLEIMLIKGENDDPESIVRFRDIVARINPDKVHINIPHRAVSSPGLMPDDKIVAQARKILENR
ncbi:MAG: radical SAM protein [Candidatus Omnitrophota bacterium]